MPNNGARPASDVLTARAVKKPKPSDGEIKEANIHRTFSEWAHARGVVTEGVEATRIPGAGYGLVAIRKLKKGERLVFVPERAMFKPMPSVIRKTGPKLSPQGHLVASLVNLLHKSRSDLDTWTDTWPKDVDLPIFWPKHMQEHLPHGALHPLERQRKDYAEDWQRCQALCKENDFSEDSYQYLWSIVNSRSFHWKPEGLAKGAMVMCPYMDYINHAPSGHGVIVQMSPAGYEVVADRRYDAGEELFATYGTHGNDKLLVHYGFVIPWSRERSNDDDEMRIDHLLIPKMTADQRSQLQDVGFLGGYALLPATKDICFKTQVAVRSLLLTSNEWEHYMANGEDLGDDKSGQVLSFLAPMLRKYRDQAGAKVKELGSLDMPVRESDKISTADLVRSRTMNNRWWDIHTTCEDVLKNLENQH